MYSGNYLQNKGLLINIPSADFDIQLTKERLRYAESLL